MMNDVALRELQRFVGTQTNGKGYVHASYTQSGSMVELSEVIVDGKMLCPAIMFETKNGTIETSAALVLIELKKWQFHGYDKIRSKT